MALLRCTSKSGTSFDGADPAPICTESNTSSHELSTNPGADIYQGLSEQIEDLEEDEFYAVLHRVQQFDPPGVAAEGLKDWTSLPQSFVPERDLGSESKQLFRLIYALK
jgi:hypothetical protein